MGIMVEDIVLALCWIIIVGVELVFLACGGGKKGQVRQQGNRAECLKAPASQDSQDKSCYQFNPFLKGSATLFWP